MRIIAHLGVLDEVELIGPALDHLYRIGVDHVVALDMGSSDGTLELLRRRAGPELDVASLPNATPWDTWRDTAVERVRRAGGDWVLFLDADEFWLPRTGRLRDSLEQCDADILVVDRFNVVLGPDGPAIPESPTPDRYADILMYCRHTTDFRGHLDAHPEVAWLSGVPAAKVIGRLGHVESITMGGHDIVEPERGGARRRRAEDIVIAHVPVSTLRRFRRRLGNIDEFLALSPDYLQGVQGWHWRRWAEIHRRGEVEQEYRRQCLDATILQTLRQDGAICPASDLLATNQGKA